MNIGIFSECYKPTKNGVVTSIETFREAYELAGHKVFIFAPKTWGYTDAADGHVFRYPSVIFPGQSYYPLAVPCHRVNQDISLLNLDIIHVQSLFTVSRNGRAEARKFNIPLVMTYHTLIEDYAHYVPFFQGLTRKFLIKLSRNFANSCDTVATPSEPMKKKLIEYGVTEPIEVIPTGLKLAEFHRSDPAKVKQKYGLDGRKKLLIYSGRIAEEKDLPFLLRAFQKIIAGFSPVHLIIAGDGPEKGEIENLAKKLRLDRYITFAGFLERNQLLDLYGAADIFVFPSKTETQGLVIIEAFASYTPAVAVDAMGPSTIIEDGKSGYLVENDENIFAQKVVKLLRNPDLLKKMSQAARQRAEDYDYLKTGNKMLELYKELIEKYKK